MGDNNPMVVANTVSALAEIQESAPDTKSFVITSTVLNKLLLALNECTEWGRIAILTALAQYKSVNQTEAIHIVERVVPQFQHVNPSVVLAAIKAVIAHLDTQTPDSRAALLKRWGLLSLLLFRLTQKSNMWLLEISKSFCKSSLHFGSRAEGIFASIMTRLI